MMQQQLARYVPRYLVGHTKLRDDSPVWVRRVGFSAGWAEQLQVPLDLSKVHQVHPEGRPRRMEYLSLYYKNNLGSKRSRYRGGLLPISLYHDKSLTSIHVLTRLLLN